MEEPALLEQKRRRDEQKGNFMNVSVVCRIKPMALQSANYCQ